MSKTFMMENAFHDFADFVCSVGRNENDIEYIGAEDSLLSDSAMSFLRKIYCQELADRSQDNYIRLKQDTKLELNSVKAVLETLYSFLTSHNEFKKYGRCVEVCVSDILNQYHFGYQLSFNNKSISSYTGIHKEIKALLVKLGELTDKKICDSYYCDD